MRLQRLSRQYLAHAMSQGPLGAAPFSPHVCEAELRRALACDHEEIDARRNEVGPEPEAFAAQPLDAVALGRTPDLLGDDEAEPRGAKRAGGADACGRPRDEEDEMSARGSSRTRRCRLDSLEVRVLPDAQARRKRTAHEGTSRTSELQAFTGAARAPAPTSLLVE